MTASWQRVRQPLFEAILVWKLNRFARSRVEQVDVAIVKAYAQDLRGLLEEADFTERKTFLRSFIKRIEINKKQVTIRYKLPLPQSGQTRERAEVLPIDTPGGIKCPQCDKNVRISLS